MSALFSQLLAAMRSLDAIVADWGNITLSFPTISGTNSDLVLSWTAGGARNISANYAGAGTLEYRINSGAWTTYTAPFSVSSGQTVGWRYAPANESVVVTVTDDARIQAIDTFTVSGSGYP